MILHFKMQLIQEQLKLLILIHTLDQMESYLLEIFINIHKLMQKILRKVKEVQNKYVKMLGSKAPNIYKFKSIPFYASPVMHGFYLSDS